MVTKLFVPLCAVFFLVGCHRYVEEKRFGKITKYVYITKDFMGKGGATYYEYCTDKRARCFGSKFFAKEVYFESKNVGRLLIGMYGDYSEGADSRTLQEFRFFDSIIGQEIRCQNCENEAYDPSTSKWFGNGRYLLHSPNRPDLRGLTFEILEIKGLVATRRSIQANGATFVGTDRSPDDQIIAWLECKSAENACTLFWLNDDLGGVNRETINCRSDEMEIYWDGHTPKIGMRFEY
jgi:hypothetical protein